MTTQQLPERRGPRPATTPINPHRQLEQNAPSTLQEALWDRMRQLAGVETGASLVSVPGARAIFIGKHCCNDADGACMIDRAFAHIHPLDDGSLHVTLPDDVRDAAIARGWAEPHPLIAQGRVPATVVMIYGPRDAEELETVWSLIVASHAFATGRQLTQDPVATA